LKTVFRLAELTFGGGCRIISDNRIIHNTVRENALLELADGNSNCDMNLWRENEFNTSAVGPDLSEDPGCIR
jgi:hypothetical protein